MSYWRCEEVTCPMYWRTESDHLSYSLTPQINSLTPGPFFEFPSISCPQGHTDLRVDFKYNQHSMSRGTALQNVSLAVPVDGGVTSMMSEPKVTLDTRTLKTRTH